MFKLCVCVCVFSLIFIFNEGFFELMLLLLLAAIKRPEKLLTKYRYISFSYNFNSKPKLLPRLIHFVYIFCQYPYYLNVIDILCDNIMCIDALLFNHIIIIIIFPKKKEHRYFLLLLNPYDSSIFIIVNNKSVQTLNFAINCFSIHFRFFRFVSVVVVVVVVILFANVSHPSHCDWHARISGDRLRGCYTSDK